MSRRDEAEMREQAWRAKQGPDVAMRYKFRVFGNGRPCRAQCLRRTTSGNVPDLAPVTCLRAACWKVARAPYCVTGVRYYCCVHCPDIPEGTP